MGIVFLVIIFSLFVIWLLDKGPAYKLRAKFISLGTLVGKSKQQITSVVDLPQSISSVNSIQVHYIATWNRISSLHRNCYDITLQFDYNDICVGILSETYFFI